MNKASKLKRLIDDNLSEYNEFQRHITVATKAFDTLIEAYGPHHEKTPRTFDAKAVVLKLMEANAPKFLKPTEQDEFIVYMSAYSDYPLAMAAIKEDYPGRTAKSLVKQLVKSGDLVKTYSNSGATTFYRLSDDWLSPDPGVSTGHANCPRCKGRDGMWFCKGCEEWVPGICVTFEEAHDGCGGACGLCPDCGK